MNIDQMIERLQRAKKVSEKVKRSVDMDKLGQLPEDIVSELESLYDQLEKHQEMDTKDAFGLDFIKKVLKLHVDILLRMVAMGTIFKEKEAAEGLDNFLRMIGKIYIVKRTLELTETSKD